MRYFQVAKCVSQNADYLGRNPNPEADWHFALPVIMWEIPLT
jgi:hypothetical protein